MRRTLSIIAGLATAIPTLLAAFFFVLIETPHGLRLLDQLARPAITAAIEEQLGSTVRFAPLAGDLPREILLEDIVLTAEGRDWAQISRIRISGNLLALIGGRVDLDALEISGARLMASPPTFPERPLTQRNFDGRLPQLEIRRLSVADFRVAPALFGQAYAGRLDGRVVMGGTMLSVDAQMDTSDAADAIRLQADLSEAGLQLSASVLGAPNGLLAQAIGARGAVWLRLDGSGPLDAFEGQIEGEAGLFGGAGGMVRGNLARGDDASAIVRLLPGPGVGTALKRLAGDDLTLRIRTRRDGKALGFSIEQLEGAFGRIGGDVKLSTTAPRRLVADLSGVLTPSAFTVLGAPDFSGPATLRATVMPGRSGVGFDGTLRVPGVQLAITEGKRDASGRVAATAMIDWQRATGVPVVDALLTDGARGRVQVIADPAAGAIDLQKLDITLGPAGRPAAQVTGDARFTARAGGASELVSNLRLRASAASIAAALPGVAMAGETVGEIQLRGTLSALELNADIRLPTITQGAVTWPAGRLSAQLRDLPGAPSGRLGFVATDGKIQAQATLASTATTLRLAPFDLSYGPGQINATAQYDRATKALELIARGTSSSPVRLSPTLELSGATDIRVVYSGTDGRITASATGDTARVNNISLETFSLDTEGAVHTPTITLRAGRIDQAQRNIRNLVAIGDVLPGSTPGLRLTALDMQVAAAPVETPVRLLSPVDITVGNGAGGMTVRTTAMRLALAGTSVAEFTGGWSARRWDGTAKLTAFPLETLRGALSADVALDTNADEVARFDVTLQSGVGAQRRQILANGTWDGAQVTLETNMQGTAGDAAMSVQYPVRLRRGKALSVDLPDGPVSGSLRLDGPIAPLFAFAPVAAINVTGRITGALEFSGSARTPRARGTLTIADSRVEDQLVGVAVTDLGGTIAIDAGPPAQGLDIKLVGRGIAETGRVEIGGRIERVDRDMRFDLIATIRRARLLATPNLDLTGSGAFTFSGPLTAPRLSGELTIDELVAKVPDGTTGAGRSNLAPVRVRPVGFAAVDGARPRPAPVAADGVTLDLSISADDDIRITGRGLDSVWGAEVRIDGPATRPRLSGAIDAVRGSLDFAGRKLRLERGRLTLGGSRIEDTLLDMLATTQTDEVTVGVNVQGTLEAPEVALRATPALPDEEILALLLFGKAASDLSAFETLEIANALAQLSGTARVVSTGRLSAALGLDALSFGVDDRTGAGEVRVGKYVTDDVYVTLRQSAGEAAPEVTVTYEVTDNVTVESTLKPDGAQNVSANYKRDY